MDVNKLILDTEDVDNRHWDEDDMEEIIFEPEDEGWSVTLIICAAMAVVVLLCLIIKSWNRARLQGGARARQSTGRVLSAEEVANKRLQRFGGQSASQNPTTNTTKMEPSTSGNVRQRQQGKRDVELQSAKPKDTTGLPKTSRSTLEERKPQMQAEKTEAQAQKETMKPQAQKEKTKVQLEKSQPQHIQAKEITPVSSAISTQRPESEVRAKTPDGRASASRSAKPPELSAEERLLQLLSQLLDCNVALRGRQGGTPDLHTLTVKPDELPTSDKFPEKCDVLFDRRFVWESIGQVDFCCRCYNAAGTCQAPEDSDEKRIVEAFKIKAVKTLLTTLQQDDTLADEDGLWSDYKSSNTSNNRPEHVEFLYRIAGQSKVNIGRDLLHSILTSASEDPNGVKVIEKVILGGANQIKKQRFDEMIAIDGVFRGLEALFMQPAILPILSQKMEKEISDGIKSLGSYFETHTLLGPLFSVSTVSPDFREMTDLRPSATNPNMPWLQLKGYPNVRPDDLQLLESQIYHCLRSLQTMLHKLFVRLLRQKKEVTLAWLATLLNMNDSRINVVANTRPDPDMIQSTCTDGFMLNIVHLLLDLSLKVFTDRSSRSKISPEYYTSPSCRLNMAATACLVGGQITRDECQARASGSGLLDPEHQEQYKFHTEIVVLAQRAVFLGFFPARTMFNKFTQILDRSRGIQQIDMNTPAGEAFKRTNLLFHLRWECVLMDPELSRKGSEFFLGLARWISEVLEQQEEDGKQAYERLVSVPQYVVRDLGEWFWFTVTYTLHRHKTALDGLELTPFVDVCVTLLRRQELQCGPIAATTLIKALHSFIQADRQAGSHNIWNRSWGSSALAHGELLVFACPAVQQHLAPALLSTYISVDVVEGLDVSKDDFDKFSARSYIGRLLERMWERQETQQSIVSLCGTKLFQDFLWCVLDFLLFPQHEAFRQLASIKKIEKEIEDKAAWKSLPAAEREEKLKLLQGDKYFAKLNNRSVSDLLQLIDLLTQHDAVARCFTQDDRLAARAATAFLEFYENLCGPRAGEHKVKDMDKYNFDPVALLATCTNVLLRIVAQDETCPQAVTSDAASTESKEAESVGRFVRCLALDPTYSEASLRHAVNVMCSGKVAIAGKAADRLSELIDQITVIQLEHESSQGTLTVSWQQQYAQMSIDADALAERYKEAMTPLMFGQAAILDSHVHRAKAQAANPSGQAVKRIAKEIAVWQREFPMTSQAAIFLRQDSQRMDTVRCIVTGPAGSPYAYGCYLFDVYFPPTYPEHAPVIKHLTTGNNTVRFSHNLYEDGKVCLSLLGFAEGSETERWQKDKSTLYQVLLSIQSIILVPDAMYRDPRFEGLRGLEEGRRREAEYNTQIRISSLRYTMIHMLRSPPAGMEVVVRNHFRLVRPALLTAACDWLKECPDQHTQNKMSRFLDELVIELDKLGDELEEEKEEEDEDEMED